jgi:uncharacterized membrane protein
MPKSSTNFWLSKKALIILALVLSLVFLLLPHKAHGYGYSWDINSFHTDIFVQNDGTLQITETLEIDYTREPHRGPIRWIPIKYPDKYGNRLNLRFELISVTDETGRPYNYALWYEGENVKLRIGDENKYLNNVTTYVIKYSVKRAVLFHFEDHDEIYWNATGDKWNVGIENATSTVRLPEKIAGVKATCFTGSYGATSENCTHSIDGNEIIFKADPLKAFEGLTIAVAFHKGFVNPPPLIQQLTWFFTDNWPYLLPILTFLILYYLWWTRGRDEKTSRNTIMPIYRPPDNLSPSEIGTLIDEHADMRDLSATIIDLAVRGYIEIKEISEKVLFFDNKDYEFKLLKDYAYDQDLKKHEANTLKGIFGESKSIKLSSLKYKFYKDLPAIKEDIYQQLVDKGFFQTNPEKIRNIYYGLGLGIIFAAFFAFGLFAEWMISVPIGAIISGIVILIFARHMPAKTKKGTEMYFQILGLEEFIKTAETDRIKFQEKENIFEKLLPYAMALNIADKWSDAFKEIYTQSPDWYKSSDPNFARNFNSYYLFSSLTRMNTNIQETLAAAPRSSGSGGAWSGGGGFGGGGFSGGGFGGGGGSSW